MINPSLMGTETFGHTDFGVSHEIKYLRFLCAAFTLTLSTTAFEKDLISSSATKKNA